MAKKSPALWDAAPHTIAKIEILKNYLNAWFPIVGSRFNELVYVDGFAGPGEYLNHSEGSPVAALKVFNSWIAKAPDKLAISKITTVFIEANLQRFELLKEKLGGMRMPARLCPVPLRGEFNTILNELIADQSLSACFGGSQPLLIFADPFGGTGAPFQLLERCLSSSGSELLLNFDADGIARIYSGKNEGWREQLDEIFGCRDWEDVLGNPNDSLVRRAEKCLALYKRKLLEIKGVDFVWTFEMRGKNDRINYYLVFATRNRLGMEKMKEAMQAIDASGQYCFSDAHFDQHVLFRADDAAFFADLMHGNFLSREVSYAELDRYALCETPFLNPKKMLDVLSRSGRVKVQPRAGETIKAHSFPEERIDTISFIEATVKATQATFFNF